MKGKSKWIWPVALLALALVALVLVSPAMRAAAKPAAQPAGGGGLNHYNFGFEESLKPWTSVADGAPSYSLTQVSGDNGCADPFGGLVNNHYARLTSDQAVVASAPMVPATWMVAPLAAGIGEYQVTVEWSARLDNKMPVTNIKAGTEVSCQTCYPMAFIGSGAPEAGAQLKIVDTKNPLDKSWRNYRYQAVVESSAKGLVYVALGWNGTGMSIGLDCVDVTFTAVIAPSAAAR